MHKECNIKNDVHLFFEPNITKQWQTKTMTSASIDKTMECVINTTKNTNTTLSFWIKHRASSFWTKHVVYRMKWKQIEKGLLMFS
jgi:hypothetical protein